MVVSKQTDTGTVNFFRRRDIWLPLLVFGILLIFGWLEYGFQRAHEKTLLARRTAILANQIGAGMEISLLSSVAILQQEELDAYHYFSEDIHPGLVGPDSILLIDQHGNMFPFPPDSLQGQAPQGILSKAVSPSLWLAHQRVVSDRLPHVGLLVETAELDSSLAVIVPVASESARGLALIAYFGIDRLARETMIASLRSSYILGISLEHRLGTGESTRIQAPSDLHRYHRFRLFDSTMEIKLTPSPGMVAAELISPLSPLPLISLVVALVITWFLHILILRTEALEHAQTRLEESERKYRDLFNTSPSGILRYDAAGCVTDGNPALLAMLGKSGTLQGRPIAEEPGLDDLIEPVRETLAGTEAILEMEIGEPEAGGQRYLHAELVPLWNSNGDVAGGVAVLEDVTPAHQADQLQRVLYTIADTTSRAENLEHLYEAIRISLSEVLDTTNFFIALYDGQADMISYPYYMDEFDEQPEPGKLKKGLTAFVIRNGTSLFVRKKDMLEMADRGQINIEGTLSEEWLGSPLAIDNRIMGVLSVQSYRSADLYQESDLEILNFVSDQVARAIRFQEAQEALQNSEIRFRRQAEELQDSNELKELLLDIITHDLRNPASVIQSLAQELVAEEDREETRLVLESSVSLLGVIENTSAMARVVLGEQLPTMDVDVSAMTERISHEYKQVLAQSGRSLVCRIEPDIHVHAHPILGEALVNYLSNANKYSPEGDEILLSLQRDGKIIRIEVADHGEGIPEDMREKIFQRQAQRKRHVGMGRGLGLAIVQRIIDALGGEVGVKENATGGNTFYIILPLE